MPKALFKNQRWLACAYMLSTSLLTTLLAISALSLIGLSELLPLKNSLLLASLLAITIGLIKNRTILNTQYNYKRAFMIGMGLFLLILPLFDIGALFMMQNQFHGTDVLHSQWSEYMTLYIIILIYSFLFIGSWLSLISGLLFMGFNQLFLTKPNSHVYQTLIH